MDIQEKVRIYAQVGGSLCLDFVNTTGSYKAENPRDYLTSYSDLVEWGLQMGVVTAQEADKLLEQASPQAYEAEAVLHRAREMRRAMYSIFSAIAEGQGSGEVGLETLNVELSRALSHQVLAQVGDDYKWVWSANDEALDRMLWPVVRSAADLLTGEKEQLQRVRECAGGTCGWLFVDMSRNHSRQWCDMRDCGNRVKAHRHYQRKKGRAES